MRKYCLILILVFIFESLYSQEQSAIESPQVFEKQPPSYLARLEALSQQFHSEENQYPFTYAELEILKSQVQLLLSNINSDIENDRDTRYEWAAKAETLLSAINNKRVVGKPSWQMNLALGFSLTGGNSDLINLNGSFLVNRNILWVHEISYQLHFDYRLNQAQRTYSKLETGLRYGHSLTRSLYLFVQGEYTKDYAASIDHRMKFYSGIGYWIFDILSPKLQLGCEIGGGWYKDYYYGDITDSHFILNGRFWFLWNFTPSLTFQQDASIYPAADDLSEFRFTLKSDTRIVWQFTATYNLIFELDVDYNSHPQPSVKALDYSQRIKLEWKI